MEPVNDGDVGNREEYELTNEESLRVSRHAGVYSAVSFIVRDMESAIVTSQEDIKQLEQRLEYEKQRLDVYENNLEKVKSEAEAARVKLSSSIQDAGLRLGINVADLQSYDVKVNSDGDVTHLVEPSSEDQKAKEEPQEDYQES